MLKRGQFVRSEVKGMYCSDTSGSIIVSCCVCMHGCVCVYVCMYI